MARLNAPKTLADRADAVGNYEGGLAFRVSPEVELYLLACTALFGEDKYYTSGSAEHERLVRLVDQVDPVYVLRLAEYVRNRMHLRTVAQVLLAEAAARWHGAHPAFGGSPVRALVPRIAIRADEPMEVLAYWHRTRGSLRSFPNALRRGLAEAVRRFDAYQLDKYDRPGAIRLRDAIALLHPKPRDAAQSQLFRQAVTGGLPPALTWEREIRRHGNRPEVWDRIASHMGLLALVRNLRSLLGYRQVRRGRLRWYVKQHEPARRALEVAASALRDPERVRASRILPFQFYAAYRQVRGLDGASDEVLEVLAALNAALEASVDSVPDLPGTTVVLVDVSGSMDDRLSRHSSVTRADVAATLAAVLWRKTGARVMAYSSDSVWVELPRDLSVLEAVGRITRAVAHRGTFLYAAFDRLLQEGVAADRVLVISDEQSYGPTSSLPVLQPASLAQRLCSGAYDAASAWARYRARTSGARLVDIDVAGYGTVQFVPDDPSITLLAGWSDWVLTLVRAVEERESVVASLNEL